MTTTTRTCENCGNARCEQMSGGSPAYPDIYTCCQCHEFRAPGQWCEGCRS